MGVNLDKPDRWKADVAESVDMFNEWFMRFAPKAFRETRVKTTKEVEKTLKATGNLTNVEPEVLRKNPEALRTLRMSTCPPLARDRLIGLADVPKSMVKRMEDDGLLPVRLKGAELDEELKKIGVIVEKMADYDIFPWLESGETPTDHEVERAATVVADRLCGATANPIIRNAQEERQLKLVADWLHAKGYVLYSPRGGVNHEDMPPGTYAFHVNVPGRQEDDSGVKMVKISVDAVIKRKGSEPGSLPLLVEAKSAGDYTNVNKRRKEEVTKVQQLRREHGDGIEYIVFLCGYFNAGYLGFEASEGIDWVWEHRIDDLAEFGV